MLGMYHASYTEAQIYGPQYSEALLSTAAARKICFEDDDYDGRSNDNPTMPSRHTGIASPSPQTNFARRSVYTAVSHIP